MSTSILTVDIQSQQMVSVLFSHGLKGTQMVDSLACRIPAASVGDETYFTDVKKALAEISARMGHRYDRCLMSIPANRFLFRTLDLPFKQRRKISQIIPFELESYLPFPTGTFEFDFCVLDKDSVPAAPTHPVSVASISRQAIEQYKACFADCGLSTDKIIVGTGYSTALVFAGMTAPADLSILVDVDPFLAGIYMIRSGQIVYCRSFALSQDAPETVVEKNVLHTCLAFDERFTNKRAVTRVAVSGSADFLDRLIENLETRMQVPVQRFNPVDALKITSGRPDSGALQNTPIQNAVAMAAVDIKGGDGYNFSRQVSGMAALYEEHRFSLVFSLILAILVLTTWAVQPILAINDMEKRRQELDRRIVQAFQSSFPEITTIVDPVQQMQVQIAALKKDTSMDAMGEHLLNIDVLHGISRVLPDDMDIVMTRFVRIENNLVLSGSADQFNTVDRMKSYFEDVEIFRDVDINSASMDKIENRVNFSLKILF
jgi:general secretion pathway protein L